MRYDRAADIVRLAVRLQGTWSGLTLADIQRDFEVSRRTAERLRDAVVEVFGPLEAVDTADAKRHWRLRAPVLRTLVSLSAEELAELAAAGAVLRRAGLEERALMLHSLSDKLRALLETDTRSRIEPGLQALTEAEGLAMRPGPHPRLDEGLFALLRHAIGASRVVTFEYPARATGTRSQRCVEPYGVLYGNRAFLVGRPVRGTKLQLWRLARISAAAVTEQPFTRDEAFDFGRFARRSFGTFHEQPVAVRLRFAARVAEDVAEFLFHPDQVVGRNADGSITVRFTAGGIKEICWHLVTWGTAVTVEQPASLRGRLTEMCATLAAHHGASSRATTGERQSSSGTGLASGVVMEETRRQRYGGREFE